MDKLEHEIYTETGIRVHIEPRPEGTFSIWHNDIILIDYCIDENIDSNEIKAALEIAKRRKVLRTLVGTKRVIVYFKNGDSFACSYLRSDGQFNVIYLETIEELLDKALAHIAE
ncbi:hypothetical protein [Turicibacter sanguinis]|uniref:hypothetical protein n=1 Tax=Turicibacter sanguinis TaxID=154288 RepID=UPI0018AC352A|nr:hypothetical protein [Turicibacter sanguinis]MDB8554040.1 hypothetical protein [Turicibacter sanguinis]